MRIAQVFLLVHKYILTPAQQNILVSIAGAVDELRVPLQYLFSQLARLAGLGLGLVGKLGGDSLKLECIRPVFAVQQRDLTVCDAVRLAGYPLGNDKGREI